MSRLLSEIKQQDEAAAAVLEEAELHTDSDIQSLTREELHELLPGNKKFQLRRTIFKIIHKQKPVDQVLKELKEFIPRESLRDALTNNGVLVDYLHILKTQMNHVLDAHISILEGISTKQPNQQSATCGPDPVSHNGQPDGLQQGAPDSLPGPSTSDASGEMGHYTGPTGGYPQGPQNSYSGTGISGAGDQTVFLTGQTGTNTSATDDPMKSHHGQSDGGSQGTSGASTSATDGQVRSLNDQTDGGPKRARDSYSGTGTSGAGGQTVFLTGQTGTNTSATNDPMKSHHGQTDGGSQGARGPSTSATDGQVQSHNDQTDGGPKRTRDSYSGTGTSGAGGQTVFLTGQTDSLPGRGTSDASGEIKPHTGQTGGPTGLWSRLQRYGKQQWSSATGGLTESLNDKPEAGPQGAQAKLKYRMVVSGKTFGAHLKLMERVKDQVQNQLQLDESSQDHEITFLFCPICSRVASDVEAAMTDVKDDEPVILVLMHHTREVKYTSSLKTWHDNNNVVLFINVLYHETIKGLLKCEENNAAVSKIQKYLLERFFPGSKDSRGNPQGMGARGLIGNTSGRGGGNDRGSDVDSSSSGFSMWPQGWWRGQ